MQFDLRVQFFVAVLALPASVLAAYGASDSPPEPLASVESFSSIGDTAARSAAIFTELGKVLTHPRCLNCHPAGDRPRQGDVSRLHQPPVERGADGFGLPAMRCPICHRRANFDPAGVPGNPIWHLAPREMAWEGKTLGEICAQIKDPARNGNRSARRARRAYRRGPSGRLGLGARIRPAAGSRHAEGSRRAGRGVGENRSSMPELKAVPVRIDLALPQSLASPAGLQNSGRPEFRCNFHLLRKTLLRRSYKL